MYRIEDRSSAIREVQRFLLVVAQRDDKLPHITVDGVWSDETGAAVSEFQKNRALFVTGTVDKNTFDLLFAEALAITDEQEQKREAINESVFPLRQGDSGHDVSILNTRLRRLAESYIDIEELPYGNFYSKATDSAVRFMQKVLRRDIDGIVSIELFNILKNEIDARKFFSDNQ